MRGNRYAMTLITLATLSACGQPERPRTVSDTYCLNSRRLTVEPAPIKGQDDPGNIFDSEETVNQVLESNSVYDALCAKGK